MILTLTCLGAARCSRQTWSTACSNSCNTYQARRDWCLLTSHSGQFLKSRGKTLLQGGHICCKSAPHYSPLKAYSVMGTAVQVGTFPVCIHTYFLCTHKKLRCVFLYIHVGKDRKHFSLPLHAFSYGFLIIRVTPP